MYNSDQKGSPREASPKAGEAGQTLIELIVVISVSVIVIGALVFATIASLRNAQFSKNQSQATKLAQEGIERVRTGRDRNQCVGIGGTNIYSWNGNNATCTNSNSFWDYRIDGNCGNTTLNPPSYCYFNVMDNGSLSYLGPLTPTATQRVPPGAQSLVFPFTRAIIISDDASYANRKTVTAIVTWTDFSGSHESRLTTILGKL